MKATLEHVFRVTIRSSAQAVWDEITRCGVAQPAMFGMVLDAEFRPGGRMWYRDPESGEVQIRGEVLEVQPPRRLVHTFAFVSLAEAPTRVTYELHDVIGGVELVVTHDRFAGPTQTYQKVSAGWPAILQGLRSLLETGGTTVLRECPAVCGNDACG